LLTMMTSGDIPTSGENTLRSLNSSSQTEENTNVVAPDINLRFPDLGAASPTQLMSPKWHWDKDELGEDPAGAVKKKSAARSIDAALGKINAIAAVLDKRVTATSNAVDTSIEGSLGSTIQQVNQLAGKLNTGAAHTIKLAGEAGSDDLRSSNSPETEDSADFRGGGSGSSASLAAQLAAAHKEIGQLHAALLEKKAQNNEQTKQLDIMRANQGSNEETAQRVAEKWASQHFSDLNKDVRHFTSKLMSLKRQGERRHIAQVSTAAWLSQEKMVDDSADDLRMAEYEGDHASQKFLTARQRAAEETKARVVLKKKALWAQQKFEGYGPKMSPERATASAVARQIAREREDAKTEAAKDEKIYKRSVARQLEYLQNLSGYGSEMLLSQQRSLLIQKKHFEMKLEAMKYRLEAEIARRTSCKSVQENLGFAQEKCQCKQISQWKSQLEHGENRVLIAHLEAENHEYEREVERCKMAYRKAGLVYAVPAKKGDFHKYALSGKAPSAKYNSSSVTPRLDPKSLKVLHDLQSKDPDALSLEILEQRERARNLKEPRA